MSQDLRELMLTLTPRQHKQLSADLARLRRKTGAPSNTAAILAAVRDQAEDTPTSKRRKAAA